MALIDKLEQYLNNPETTRIKFLQQYKDRDKTFHLFFEGQEDESFYLNSVQEYIPDGYKTIHYNCGGKRNVLTNYSDINWNYFNRNRCLFFTDKDLDDVIGKVCQVDENIFETRYYSIENYLVCTDIYTRVLRELFCMTDERIINDLNLKFIEQQRVFYRRVLVLMAWVAYNRSSSLILNLGDFDFAKLFSIDDEFNLVKQKLVEGEKPFQYICRKIEKNNFDFKLVLSYSRKLSSIGEPKAFVRGKYELWFLYAFCKKTIDIAIPKINKQIKEHNKRTERNKRENANHHVEKIPKCSITVDLKFENILQIVAPRLNTPFELKKFLNDNMSKVKKSAM